MALGEVFNLCPPVAIGSRGSAHQGVNAHESGGHAAERSGSAGECALHLLAALGAFLAEALGFLLKAAHFARHFIKRARHVFFVACKLYLYVTHSITLMEILSNR